MPGDVLNRYSFADTLDTAPCAPNRRVVSPPALRITHRPIFPTFPFKPLRMANTACRTTAFGVLLLRFRIQDGFTGCLAILIDKTVTAYQRIWVLAFDLIPAQVASMSTNGEKLSSLELSSRQVQNFMTWTILCRLTLDENARPVRNKSVAAGKGGDAPDFSLDLTDLKPEFMYLKCKNAITTKHQCVKEFLSTCRRKHLLVQGNIRRCLHPLGPHSRRKLTQREN